MGEEYLVYREDHEEFTVDVYPNTYAVEWFDPENGTVAHESDRTVIVEGDEVFTPPAGFLADAVLYLTIYERTPRHSRPR